MAIIVDIRTLGVRKLMADLARFDKKVSQEATVQALNRTINNMQTTAIKEGAKWMGIRRGLIQRRFEFAVRSKMGGVGTIKAGRRVRMEARAIVRGRPFNLIRFGALGTRGGGEQGSGVTANAWGNTRLYRGLGIARNPASFVFVVNKQGKTKKRIRRGAYGPGLMDAMAEPKITLAIRTTAQVQFLKHFTSAANFRLQRAGWRTARVVT